MDTKRTPSIDELWATLQEQRATLLQQREEIAQLRAELEQHTVKQPLPSSCIRQGGAAPSEHFVTQVSDVNPGQNTNTRRFSRSALLRAAAAGVAGVAGAEVLSVPTPAGATQGQPVIAGQSNTASSPTVVDVSAAVYPPNAISGVADQGDGLYGQSQSGSGVYGNSTSGYGVLGTSSTSTGVYGSSSSGTAIAGSSDSHIAIDGASKTGYGVFAHSQSAVDLAAGGTGRLFLKPQGTAGPPAQGTYSVGEQVVDSNGVPYVCTSDGTPGGWQAIGNLRLFSYSRRVFGDGSVIPKGTITAPIDAGAPAEAQTAYCAVQADAHGVMTLFPDRSFDPGIANWANTGNDGLLALFYMFVPLSSQGRFRIHTYFTGRIYVDVWGFLF